MAVVLAAVAIHPRLRSYAEIGNWHWWPLVVVGAWQLARGVHQQASPRCLAGALGLIAALTLAVEDLGFGKFGIVLSYQSVMVAALLIGTCFHDEFAAMLRRFTAVWLVATGAYVVYALEDAVSPGISTAYVLVLATIGVGIWGRMRERIWLVSATANIINAMAGPAHAAVLEVQGQFGPRVTLALGIGVACFAIGVSISAVKGGVQPVVRRWLRGIWDRTGPRVVR